MSPLQHSAFDHVGLSVGDIDAQVRWYQEVLGLSQVVTEVDIPEPPIRAVILQSDDGTRIELIQRQGSARTGPELDPMEALQSHGYVHWALRVDDLDAFFAEAIAAGAEEIWPPTQSPDPGARMAFIKDPEGNPIELLQPS